MKEKGIKPLSSVVVVPNDTFSVPLDFKAQTIKTSKLVSLFPYIIETGYLMT